MICDQDTASVRHFIISPSTLNSLIKQTGDNTKMDFEALKMTKTLMVSMENFPSLSEAGWSGASKADESGTPLQQKKKNGERIAIIRALETRFEGARQTLRAWTTKK